MERDRPQPDDAPKLTPVTPETATPSGQKPTPDTTLSQTPTSQTPTPEITPTPEDPFLRVNEEELAKDIKDPQGNMKTRKIIREKIDELVPLFKEDNHFHKLSKEQIQEDLEMYFDMYWAGWEKFQVPWYMLWIVHIQESEVSRNVNADRNGDGAMQVARGNLNTMPTVREAPDGYEKLRERPQRLSARGGRRTTDSDEILHAAAYLRLYADVRHSEDDEEALLNALEHNYSAPVYGKQRVDKYKQLKEVLEPKPEPTQTSTPQPTEQPNAQRQNREI